MPNPEIAPSRDDNGFKLISKCRRLLAQDIKKQLALRKSVHIQAHIIWFSLQEHDNKFKDI